MSAVLLMEKVTLLQKLVSSCLYQQLSRVALVRHQTKAKGQHAMEICSNSIKPREVKQV